MKKQILVIVALLGVLLAGATKASAQECASGDLECRRAQRQAAGPRTNFAPDQAQAPQTHQPQTPTQPPITIVNSLVKVNVEDRGVQQYLQLDANDVSDIQSFISEYAKVGGLGSSVDIQFRFKEKGISPAPTTKTQKAIAAAPRASQIAGYVLYRTGHYTAGEIVTSGGYVAQEVNDHLPASKIEDWDVGVTVTGLRPEATSTVPFLRFQTVRGNGGRSEGRSVFYVAGDVNMAWIGQDEYGVFHPLYVKTADGKWVDAFTKDQGGIMHHPVTGRVLRPLTARTEIGAHQARVSALLAFLHTEYVTGKETK